MLIDFNIIYVRTNIGISILKNIYKNDIPNKHKNPSTF